MPATTITARTLCLRLLRYFGITSLDPSNPSCQPFPIEPTDLDDVLDVVNAAMQDYFDDSPSEVREANLGAVLFPPTTVSLSVTNGSATISTFAAFASWMTGCTIRIAGDSQDNEVTSATLLARPFIGATGTSVSATVFGDAYQLDGTVGKVFDPVSLPNQFPLIQAADRMEFARLAGYPLVTGFGGGAYGYPFFWFMQKSVSRPMYWFLEPAYTTGLSYVPRRIRVAPMPDQQYSMGFRAAMNPVRLQATDVDNGDHTTDPGTLLPVSDSEVESIIMKLAVQQLTGKPQFKNDGAIAEIRRGYTKACQKLEQIKSAGTQPGGGYRT